MQDIDWLSGATADLELLHRHYFNLSEPYALLFLDRVNAAVQHIREFPLSSSAWRGGIRKMRIKGYPISIFFIVTPLRLLVLGIDDTRQDPDRLDRKYRDFLQP